MPDHPPPDEERARFAVVRTISRVDLKPGPMQAGLSKVPGGSLPTRKNAPGRPQQERPRERMSWGRFSCTKRYRLRGCGRDAMA
jgi:hypothetical protein